MKASPSWPHHLPKVPLPNTITKRGLGFSTWILGGNKHQSITRPILVLIFTIIFSAPFCLWLYRIRSFWNSWSGHFSRGLHLLVSLFHPVWARSAHSSEMEASPGEVRWACHCVGLGRKTGLTHTATLQSRGQRGRWLGGQQRTSQDFSCSVLVSLENDRHQA